MILGDEKTWAQKWDQAAADFLGEPVYACAQGTRTRGWSSMGLGYISPAAGMVQMMRGKKKALGLPQLFLVAATADKLYVLAMPKANFNYKKVKATKELAVWNLDDITVETESAFNAIKLSIDAPAEGEHVEVQIPEGFLGERLVAVARREVTA
jgi:hypothetical protein